MSDRHATPDRSRQNGPGRRRFLGLAAASLALPALARADTPATETITGAAFGTLWRITGPAGADIEALRRPAEDLLAGIDRQMSPWRDDSEVSLFNRAGAGGLAVSGDTATVARAALALARDSGGRFDPSVGPLVARWGFGPIEGDARPGWQELAAEGGTLAKTRAGLTLDLCGIAKGWALDRVAQMARARGHGNLLIDLGGELAALGHHPSGRLWQVAVEAPDGAAAVAVLALPGLTVATSGTVAQGYALGPRTYGHIIDPATGAPATGDLRSVSVVAPTAMAADGWATALFAAGSDAGPAMARHHGLDALFVIAEAAGPRTLMTGGMARHVPI